MGDVIPLEPEASQTKFCTMCAVFGVATPAERYKGTQLKYCTFHYWLVRGRVGPGGYSLEDYVKWSGVTFTVSLPPKADCEMMQREYDRGRLESKPVIELRA